MRLDRDTSLTPIELESEDVADFDVVTVLQGRLAEAYTNLPQELRQCSEFELCNKVDPGPTDYDLRQRMHDAVQAARKSGGKIVLAQVYGEVIIKQTFFLWYVGNPLKVAFMLRPVVTHVQFYDAIHKVGLRKMFEYVRSHDLDPKTMATFARIVEKAGDRVVGPVVQRVQMNQRQEITHITGNDPSREVTPESPEELEAKIREMQQKLASVKPVEIEAKIVEDD